MNANIQRIPKRIGTLQKVFGVMCSTVQLKIYTLLITHCTLKIVWQSPNIYRRLLQKTFKRNSYSIWCFCSAFKFIWITICFDNFVECDKVFGDASALQEPFCMPPLNSYTNISCLKGDSHSDIFTSSYKCGLDIEFLVAMGI